MGGVQTGRTRSRSAARRRDAGRRRHRELPRPAGRAANRRRTREAASRRAPDRRSALQIAPQARRNLERLKKHRAQVEVQLNSAPFALLGPRPVCILAPRAAGRPTSPPKPSAAPGALLEPADGRACRRANEIRTARAQLKRDLKAGRVSIHQLLLEPPEYLETAKVFDMLLAVPKYGRVKANKILQPVPHLAVEDHRRPVGAPARRARLRCCAGSAPSMARVFVITGPSGVGKGTLIRLPARAGAGARAVGLGHDARAAPGRARRRRLPVPLRRRSSPGTSATATSSSRPTYSGRRYGTLRSELERHARGGRPGGARDRGPGRAPGPRGDARGGADLHRAARATRRCATAWSAAAPTTPSRSSAGCAWPQEELAAAGRVQPRRRQRPARRGRCERSSEIVHGVRTLDSHDLTSHRQAARQRRLELRVGLVAAKRARQINTTTTTSVRGRSTSSRRRWSRPAPRTT